MHMVGDAKVAQVGLAMVPGGGAAVLAGVMCRRVVSGQQGAVAIGAGGGEAWIGLGRRVYGAADGGPAIHGPVNGAVGAKLHRVVLDRLGVKGELD